MSAQLPTLLKLIIDQAARGLIDEPAYQCQAGYCGQCACNESDLKSRFGDWEYIVEPSLPPFEGKALPCIARQKVISMAPSSDSFNALMETANASVVITKKLMARRPQPNEIGKALADMPGMSNVIVTNEHIIVRSVEKNKRGQYSLMLTTDEAFNASFGRVPDVGVDFSLFTKNITKLCVVIDSERMGLFPKAHDGARYYSQNEKFTLKVEEGDIMTDSGVLIDRAESYKLNLTFSHQVDNSIDLHMKL